MGTRRPYGSSAVNNPLLILQTLDKHLGHAFELTLFGRAALALGYLQHRPEHETTQDVDAIIPLTQLEALCADERFWNARDATNIALKSQGLYLTHLFTEVDVFLQPDWLGRRVRIVADLKWLTLFRPATIDLILTKMMRGADREDLSDIEFLMKQEPVTEAELRAAFGRTRVPEIPELRDTFRAAQPKVLEIARSFASAR